MKFSNEIVIYFLYFTFICQSFSYISYSDINNNVYPIESLYDVNNLFVVDGLPPSKRLYNSIAVSENEEYLVIFGGYSSFGELLNDVNIYNIFTKKWSGPILKLVCCGFNHDPVNILGYQNDTTPSYIRYGFQGDIPLARAEHTALFIRDKMYMFGGITDKFSYVNDLYLFDLNLIRWERISNTTSYNRKQIGASVPLKRAGHSMTKISNKLYVFGGRSLVNNNLNGLNDLWRYSTNIFQWNKIETLSAVKPSVRQFAGITSSEKDNLILIFGGINPLNNITYNDIWLFNVNYRIWKELQTNRNDMTFGFAPPPLFSSYIFIADENVKDLSSNTTISLFIYGGIGGTARCGGKECRPVHLTLGQIYRYEVIISSWESKLILGTWKYVSLSSGKPYKLIKPYVYESAVYLSQSNRILEFGGLQRSDYSYGDETVSIEFHPILLNTGGNLPLMESDVSGGQILSTRLPTPTNNYWSYDDDFIDQIKNNSLITYHQLLRFNKVNVETGLTLVSIR